MPESQWYSLKNVLACQRPVSDDIFLLTEHTLTFSVSTSPRKSEGTREITEERILTELLPTWKQDFEIRRSINCMVPNKLKLPQKAWLTCRRRCAE